MLQHEEYSNRVDEIFVRYASGTAITYLKEDGAQRKFTYQELYSGCQSMREALSKVGVAPGDRAAIIAPHSPAVVIAGIQLAYCNVTEVLIDATLPGEEIARLLMFSDVQTAFLADEVWEKISPDFQADMPIFRIDRKTDTFGLVVDAGMPLVTQHAVDGERDVAAIIFSSGTTSEMKGVKVTYHSIVKAAEIIIRNARWKQRYRYLHVFPFNHIAGFAVAHAILFWGSELGMIEHMNASKLLGALQTYEPDGFGMIPRVYESMEERFFEELAKKGKTASFLMQSALRVSGFFRKCFGLKLGKILFKKVTRQFLGKNIKYIGTGSAVCRESTSRFFLDMGLEWGNFYALTETDVPAVMTSRYDRYPVGSAGNIHRDPEIEVKIHDPNKEGIGEVRIKSELLTKGYFRDEQLTKDSFEEGFFKTGDYGYLDQRDNLYITGRIKESIHLRTGKKVSPTDIDHYYMQWVPGVVLASCGVSGKRGFDEIHMFIQTENLTGQQIRNAEEAIKGISANGTVLYQIAQVHKIAVIPTTTIGKVRRFLLAEKVREEAERAESYTASCRVLAEDGGSGESSDPIVQKILDHILGIELIEDTAQTLEYYGLDSLSLMELRVILEDEYGIYLPDSVNGSTRLEEIELQEKRADEKKRVSGKFFYRMLAGFAKKYVHSKFQPVVLHCDEGLFDEAVIVAPNHRQTADSMVLFGLIPKYVHWAALKRFFDGEDSIFDNNKNWFLRRFTRFLFRRLQMVPIDREGDNSEALNLLRSYLLRGECVGIYPEGTTNKQPQVQKLGLINRGAFVLAKATGKALLPVGIVWSESGKNRNRVAVCFGKEITDCRKKSLSDLEAEWENKVLCAIEECEKELG